MTRRLRPSTAELFESGRALRRRIPRSSLALLSTSARDPMGILERQNSTRLQHLVPIRSERMSASPFAFYRGSAALMAADLATAPSTGITVVSCGDAHVSNFGFFASQQRTLVFDLNDFDEAAWAPWEWDLKRLVTSLIIGGRESARSPDVIERAARRAVRAYRAALRRRLQLSPIERYYSQIDTQTGAQAMDRQSRLVARQAIKAARKRTGQRAVRRLTVMGSDGRYQFVHQPPTMTPLEAGAAAAVHRHIESFGRSAAPDIKALLDQYTEVDTARRVVGVGSVGTRCALVLLQDGDGNGLIMQSKEAGRSVLEEYGGVHQPNDLSALVQAHGQGARVVSLQRILQALSDPFLGYLRADGIDLYVRQFHDMKGGIELSELDDGPFVGYAGTCAIILARAHSQSPDAAVAAGYIGSGRAVTDALLEWATEYAAVSRRDYDTFVEAAT